ncbi:MAG TPA: DUF1501 domain-containing protein [Polyangiaceae bacterium]|nr:DUF1501 domain-containing protein [Polyangiaceae bacterium]
MQRRTLLRSLTAGAAAFAADALAPANRSGLRALAAASEGVPMVPEPLRAKSVLEVFLCGGVSQYESLYCVPEHGRTDNTHWHLFANSSELAAALEACGISEPALEPFAEDALGQTVHLGPFVAPLRRRPDLVQRLRVSMTKHDLAPHEAAIPLALSGRSLGSPRVAGLGAHILQHFSGVEGGAAGPLAYVLTSSSMNTVFIDNLRALTATGLYSALARPIEIQVEGAADFIQRLGRPSVGALHAEVDELIASYADAYASELSWPATGTLVRSPRFQDFRAASAVMTRTGTLREMFDAEGFVPKAGESCGETVEVDSVAMQFGVAARLLTHASHPARYVCVVDTGFVPNANGGGAYDSHTDNVGIQARNLTHTLAELGRWVRAPGEVDPNKIDLDSTLVLLTTEFGRTPHAEGVSGRNHWPYGYAQALLGGPIRTPGVSGACDSSARAAVAATPAESRIAAMLALGIWPFGPESFSVADVPGATSETDAAHRVLQEQLGIS